MSEPKDDGGAAFPVTEYFDEKPVGASMGMSLRDYFAIRVPEPTPEQIASEAERDRLANPHGDTYKPKRRGKLEIIAALRYAYADAMLAERRK